MSKKITASQISTAKASLREGVSVADVLQALAEGPTAPIEHDLAGVPEGTHITDEVRQALRTLPKVFGAVVVQDRRELTPAEIGSAYQEFTVLRTIGDTLKQRAETIKENIRTHVDVQAERTGDADGATVDASGHYLLARPKNPVRVDVPDANEQFSIEYRSGRSGKMTVSSEALLQAYEDGELTREQYLSLTRETRVFDEAKASKAVVADPSLLQVIRDASRVTGATEPGSSLYLRKSK